MVYGVIKISWLAKVCRIYCISIEISDKKFTLMKRISHPLQIYLNIKTKQKIIFMHDSPPLHYTFTLCSCSLCNLKWFYNSKIFLEYKYIGKQNVVPEITKGLVVSLWTNSAGYFIILFCQLKLTFADTTTDFEDYVPCMCT